MMVHLILLALATITLSTGSLGAQIEPLDNVNVNEGIVGRGLRAATTSAAAKIKAEEERNFWERVLAEHTNSILPTQAPTPTLTAPTIATSVPAPENSAPVHYVPSPSIPVATTTTPTTPTTPNPTAQPTLHPTKISPTVLSPIVASTQPTKGYYLDNALTSFPTEETIPDPTDCPTRIRVDCATLDNNIPCENVTIPSDPTDCNVSVVYYFNMTNFGTNVRRVYTLTVWRNRVLTIVTNAAEQVPVVILEPGESFIAESPQPVELNVCTEMGVDIFDAKVDIAEGDPVESETTITCVSDEGENCDEITPLTSTTDDDECLLNVTYTYTVFNTGEIDFSIWQFNRTRNGETVSLPGDEPFVPVGGSTSTQETEEINRCEDELDEDMFATTTTVRHEPVFQDLCLNSFYYPPRLPSVSPL